MIQYYKRDFYFSFVESIDHVDSIVHIDIVQHVVNVDIVVSMYEQIALQRNVWL